MAIESLKKFVLVLTITLFGEGMFNFSMAESMDPFLADVDKIAVRVYVEPSQKFPVTILTQIISEAAADALREVAQPNQHVVILENVDPRLSRPKTLVVLVHGRIMPGGEFRNEKSENLLVLAMQLGRADQPGLSGDLFPAPPGAIPFSDAGLFLNPETKVSNKLLVTIREMMRSAIDGQK